MKLVVKGGEKRIRSLRYIGVDSPEYNEPYYQAAKALNKSLVYGKRVRLEFDQERVDKYKRLLAYVYVGDVFVNAELVRRGYARTYTIGRNIRYRNLFRQLEKQAKQKRLGIWKQEDYTSVKQ